MPFLIQSAIFLVLQRSLFTVMNYFRRKRFWFWELLLSDNYLVFLSLSLSVVNNIIDKYVDVELLKKFRHHHCDLSVNNSRSVMKAV